MNTLQISRMMLVATVFFYAIFGHSLALMDVYNSSNAQCIELSREPYFDIEQVVGKSWRIYHTWNMKMENKCLDMTLQNVTPKIINRIYHDMKDYVEYQPNWDAATLHVTMGSAKNEMLLIADQGAAGSFVGVPNIVRDGNIAPARKGVPILKFFLKLLNNGAYLLMADCNIGVMTLCAPKDKPAYRAEVATVVNSLPLGMGDPACITDKNQNEQMFIK